MTGTHPLEQIHGMAPGPVMDEKGKGACGMSDEDTIIELIKTRDRLIGIFSMVVEDAGPGTARVSMTVRPEFLNAAGLCHGGAIFSLADVAFALACNSHGTMALALETSMNFIRPAPDGEKLTAVATEISLGKTTGLYTVTVTSGGEKPVAFMKATAYRFPEALPK